MKREQLEQALQFNPVHSDDKDLMSVEMLESLHALNFKDVSWGNDECASFLSPCEHYQVFVGLTLSDYALPISVFYKSDDEDSTYLMETENLYVALCAIRTHSIYGELS